jgi:spore coat polysaccharide biosynthesis protein SpsF
MTNGILVTVRSGSSRLPGKAGLKIAGKPTIQYVFERSLRSRLAEKVVLCTTTLEDDDWLEELAGQLGIATFRGSVLDKLERWRGATERYSIDRFVTADGDDLLCEPTLMDLAFRQFGETGADLIEAPHLICGAFSYAIRTGALVKACQIKDSDDTEMMITYFKDTGLFRVEALRGAPREFERPDWRMTLDYPEDFEFFTAVIEGLIRDGSQDLGLGEAVALIEKVPEFLAINAHRSEAWASNQRAKTRLKLKEGTGA